MPEHSTIVLGGGLSGLAAAWELGRRGVRDIVVLERGATFGGLAGSFRHEGRSYPLGYHHILHKDRTLLRFLDQLGVASKVEWRRIRMLFETDRGLLNLADPRDMLRFPMSAIDKLRFAALMVRAFTTRDWSGWEQRDAAELIDRWAGPGVRASMFEPLCRLKFGLPAEAVSAAWLGARLAFREGSAPLGFIPDTNWTEILCDGVAGMARDAGAELRLRAGVQSLEVEQRRVVAAVLDDGTRITGSTFVSTVPPEIYLKWVPYEHTPCLTRISYTALISVVCGVRHHPLADCYWLNLSSLRHTACAVFTLSALNPTLGRPGEAVLNFVTHLNSRREPLFQIDDDELMARYRADYQRIFGATLAPAWTHVARVPMYSPVFDRAFANPPVRSASWDNVFFAGNYRTFPSVASTGTALESGLAAADAVWQSNRAQRRPAATEVAPAA